MVAYSSFKVCILHNLSFLDACSERPFLILRQFSPPKLKDRRLFVMLHLRLKRHFVVKK